MNHQEHLLTCIAEEGGELAQAALQLSQAAHKALRFGVDDGYPGTDRTNRGDLVRETNDLIGVLEALQEAGVALPGLFDRASIDAKKSKVSQWMGYAYGLGTLDQDSRQDSEEAQRARFEARLVRDREFNEVTLPAIRKAGESALLELVPIALGDTGQSGVVGKFLLGLYDGSRFPFDLTELRRLDRDLFEKCQAVLAMDFQPEREIHTYVEDGGQVFESMAAAWYPGH